MFVSIVHVGVEALKCPFQILKQFDTKYFCYTPIYVFVFQQYKIYVLKLLLSNNLES